MLARFTLIGKDINFTEIYGDKICQIDHSSTGLLDRRPCPEYFVCLKTFYQLFFSLSESKVIKGFYRELKQFIVITIYWFKKLTRSQPYYILGFSKVKSLHPSRYRHFINLLSCKLLIVGKCV